MPHGRERRSTTGEKVMSKCNKHRYVSTSPKVCVVCLLSQLAIKEAEARLREDLEATIAELKKLVERTCGDGCHCMKENDGQCALAALLEKNDG